MKRQFTILQDGCEHPRVCCWKPSLEPAPSWDSGKTVLLSLKEKMYDAGDNTAMTVVMRAAMGSHEDSTVSSSILFALPVMFSKPQNVPSLNFPEIFINNHVLCS